MYQPYSLRVEAKRYLIYDIDQPLPNRCRGCEKLFEEIGSLVAHEHKCSSIMEGIVNPENSTCYSMTNSNKAIEKNFRDLLEEHTKLKTDYNLVMKDIKLLRKELEFRDLIDLHPMNAEEQMKNTINSQKLEIEELREKNMAFECLNDDDRNMLRKKAETINHLRKNGANLYKECCKILDGNTTIENIRKGVNGYSILIKMLTECNNNINADVVLGILKSGKTLDDEFKYTLLNHYKTKLIKFREEIVKDGDQEALINISKLI